MLKRALRTLLWITVALNCVTVTHAATTNDNDVYYDDFESTSADQSDPYQTYNRHAFNFNDTLDKAIFKPVAQAYNFVLPYQVRKGVRNFFNNLDMIPTVFNDVLQGKINYTASDTWRFVVNSTLGIGGLIDIAKPLGMPLHEEDFGLTLATWGYKESNFFILPLLGPHTVRDALAVPVDYVTSAYYYIDNDWIHYSLIALNWTSQRAQFLEYDKTMKQAAFDPYVFQRNAYMQHRRNLVDNNDDNLSDYKRLLREIANKRAGIK